MPRLMHKISKKAGLPPGSLVHVGEKKTEYVRIRVIDYDETHMEEKELKTIEEIFAYKEKNTITWINIDGLHETDIIQKIGEFFNLHPLILEDIVHTGQRLKIDDFDDYMFVVLKMTSFDTEDKQIKEEQFSLVLGQNYVISFQEIFGDIFDPVRERMRKAKGRIRKMGPDYLMYALMDAIVDHYFIVLENMGEDVEILEDQLMENPRPEILQKIHHLKKETILLRRSVWPLREVISALQRGESDLISEPTTFYLRDLYDHTIQVIENTETLRDMVSGMLDVYLSSVSNKMNEVMKLLTIIATIFIPLTFIAGVYGMNFKTMPELEWAWGYPAVLLLMGFISGLMVFWFRFKRII